MNPPKIRFAKRKSLAVFLSENLPNYFLYRCLNGLKWVISFHDSFFRYGKDGESYGEYQVRFFASLYNYVFNHYCVEVDKHCRNLSRACYLPHDPNAYLNPSLL